MAPKLIPVEYAAAVEQARHGNPAPAIALGVNPYAARLLDSAYRARREAEQAERMAAWDTTPRKLFGHNLEAAQAAGWQFERATESYHGNRPTFYAISPTGYRYRWNSCMMHSGADPWEPVGRIL